MRYFKIFLIGIVLFATLGLLSGCGKKAKPVALIASTDKYIFTGRFEDTNLKVYKLYDNGNIVDYKNIIFNYETDSSNPNLQTVKIVDNVDKSVSPATIKIVINSASASLEEHQYFYGVKYNEIELSTTEKKQSTPLTRPYLFTNFKGGYFDFKNFLEGVEIYAIKDVSKGEEKLDFNTFIKEKGLIDSKEYENLSRLERIDANLKNEEKTLEYIKQYDEENDFEKARYNKKIKSEVQRKYEITLKHDKLDKDIKLPVYVCGGQRPIHKNVFNWFDYISVSWIGWLMGMLSFGGMFGFGILFTTIIIRTLAWPIYAKTNGMSSKMQKLQPEIEKINRKYTGRTDKESLRAKQMETMQIYKKNKVGFGSMLLPFVQMPIFIAMYNTVRRIVIHGGHYTNNVRNTYFLGIDLSIGSHWTSIILAVFVGITMILIQLMGQYKPKYQRNKVNNQVQQPKDKNKTGRIMKYVGYGMAIMMAYFSYKDNAIAMYWIFGNLFSLAQVCLYKYIDYRKHLKQDDKELI